MNILQKIFIDHYEEIEYTLHPRLTEMENIDKMINCGDPSYGGAMYGCPHCGKLKFVPFRCHSRFCPSCGIKYAMERTTSMSFKLVNVRHRHCVFTIDEQLRDFFLNDRSLLDCLFHAVNSVISRMFFKQNKSMNFTPGFIMVLHTFGRDLKWNPHIHCLISEGGYSDNGFWRNISHFNYTFLRNAFRTALLNEMEALIGPSFKKVKSRCYQEHKEGFYVYAKPNKCDPKTAIKYIGRYLGRPVIATSRIDKYDGDFVTFHYNRHEDDKYIEETVPVMEFIQRLIRHIPEKNYKMIRYGGIYARHREIDKKLHRAVSHEKHHFYRSFNQWRTAILSTFGYDPLKCECGATMLFLELYFNISMFLWKKCTRKSCPVLVERGHPHDFHKSSSYGILLSKEDIHMKQDIEKLRKKYIDNPPEGMTSRDIRHMSGDELLDMDYFLNEDDLFDDEAGVEGFYIF